MQLDRRFLSTNREAIARIKLHARLTDGPAIDQHAPLSNRVGGLLGATLQELLHQRLEAACRGRTAMIDD
jgi:hypothetical protein